MVYQGNKDSLVLAVRHEDNWLFNPSSKHVVQSGDVLMVMASVAGRDRLEKMVRGAT